MGLQLCALNRYAEGIARFRQALERGPDDAGVHNNLVIALLATGDFASGWRHQGKKWGLRENARIRPDFDAPLWRGEPLAGKSLYVWSEQGLGDQVMFAGMFPDLVASGARCTFEVQPAARAPVRALVSRAPRWWASDRASRCRAGRTTTCR